MTLMHVRGLQPLSAHQWNDLAPRTLHRGHRHAQSDRLEHSGEDRHGVRVQVVDADDRHRPACLDACEPRVERTIGGDRIDHDVDASSARRVHELRVGVVADGSPTEPDGTTPSALDGVVHVNRCCAEDERASHRAQPDGPEPQHQDRLARTDLTASCRRPRGREVVGQQQRRLVADVIGDRHQVRVGPGYRQQFRLTAAEAGTEPEDRRAAVAARRVTRAATGAVPATGDARDHDPVSDGESGYGTAQFDDGAYCFVSDREPVDRGQVSVEEVHVGTADGRGVDLDDRTERSGEHGIRKRIDSDGPSTVHHHCTHDASFTSVRPDANLRLDVICILSIRTEEQCRCPSRATWRRYGNRRCARALAHRS